MKQSPPPTHTHWLKHGPSMVLPPTLQHPDLTLQSILFCGVPDGCVFLSQWLACSLPVCFLLARQQVWDWSISWSLCLASGSGLFSLGSSSGRGRQFELESRGDAEISWKIGLILKFVHSYMYKAKKRWDEMRDSGGKGHRPGSGAGDQQGSHPWHFSVIFSEAANSSLSAAKAKACLLGMATYSCLKIEWNLHFETM